MNFGKTKKRLAVVVAVGALLIVGGGAAYAYWTTTGEGVGTATTGTSPEFIVTATTHTGGPMTPGGASETVGFTVNNPSSGDQVLWGVVVTVAKADGSVWDDVPGCSAADYTVAAPTLDRVSVVMAPGATVTGSVVVSMNHLASDQEACKDEVIPLYILAG